MIDREEVLKGLKHHRHLEASRNELSHDECFDCPYRPDGEDTCASLDHMIDDALELLKEQPEQKHGHWKGFTQSRYFGTDDDGEPIFRDGRFYICSECRRKSIIKYPYCPRCGAKMEEEV